MALQASTEQLDVVSIPLNDGSVIESKEDLDNNPYWTTYFNMVRAEKSWTKIELRKIGYVEEAQDFLVNTATDDEVGLLKPDLIMDIDEAGHSTPMACGIVVVKSIQGRVCSKLLRVLYDSGGSKSMAKKNILPKGVRLDTNGSRTLYNEYIS